ncbi:hypothetical protein [Cystobacter ferrugineus]|uniref:BIG2 domain-containing protein n=1 Tax=Cystobacter ferrugineus TaxID=83449 RepID=A0A1L9BDJ7_9BACT|nr:hypothetical protein [Cystobacter ferrugineus]OJH40298.1 hypothetical protein BON30_14770 [Cystobacter ferrugineus]
MKFSKALPWLPSLLILAGCPSQPPEPNPPGPRLDKISVTCTPTSLVAGQDAQCTASATDQEGAPISVEAYTWTSGDETLARVDASGKVTTAAAFSGNVAIRASARSGDSLIQGENSLAITPKSPTIHSRDVITAETWRAADNPHLVTFDLTVFMSGSLTLEPGVVVRFAAEAGLRLFDGTLLAEGTPEAPILLEGQDRVTPGSWNGLLLATTESVARLDHVTVSHCGAPTGEGGCLVINEQAAPVLRDVSVRDSGAVGVLVADDGSIFGPGSARLSVSGSKGPAIVIGANQADSLPPLGTLSGNASNAVELRGHVSRTLTWPNPGVPFVIPQPMKINGDKSLATLTISAGSVLRFGAKSLLYVGSKGFLGALVVDGTAQNPVLFTADSDQPKPGHWSGVNVMNKASNPGRISHATIEYAGEKPDSVQYPFAGPGNLTIFGDLFGVPEGANTFVMNDVVVQKSSHSGIFLTNGGSLGMGSSRLTSRDNGTYPITLEADAVPTIPQDTVFTGNGTNVVEINNGDVTRTQTWSRLSVPYLITNPDMLVGVAAPFPAATLTIAPGTTILFAPGTALWVGFGDTRGSLSAKGTSAEPIRFVADSEPAPRGHWRGLHFWYAEGSQLDYVVVANGGNASGVSSSYGILGEGALNVYREIGPFVTHSSFSQAKGCAVTVSKGDRQNTTPVTTDFFSPASNNSAGNNGSDTQCTN